MTGLSALLLGFGLGFRHAADADHVVVVSALLDREHSVARAARVAALWGAGHTVSFLGVGLLVVTAGLHAPPALEVAAELLVIAMLLGFGAQHALRGLWPWERPDPSSRTEKLPALDLSSSAWCTASRALPVSRCLPLLPWSPSSGLLPT